MSKFLLRLLTFTILLGAVPVMFIGLISYTIASKDIEDKVKDGNMQILQQTQLRVEQVVKALELSAIQFANSPMVVNSYNERLTSEEFTEIKDLSKGLYNLQTATNVREAYLINPEQDWLISFRLFCPFNDFPQKELFTSYMERPESLFWVTHRNSTAVQEAPAAESAASDEASSRPTVSMVLKIPTVPLTNRPRELLIVEIPDTELQTQLGSTEQWGEHYVLDSEGNDFLSTGGKEGYKAINQRVSRIVHETDQEQGFFNSELNSREVAVTYRVSPYTGWIYVNVVSIEEITKQSRKIALMTWGVCAILFAVIAVLAFFGTRRMYTPIRKLLEFTKGMEPDAPPNQNSDEFSFIEGRLRALSNTGKQLQQQVRGQYVQLKEFFVMKLFSGQISESDFMYRARICGFPSEWKRLGVLTLQIDTLDNTRFREHDRELLLFAINNIVGELVEASSSFSPILLDQSQITLLTSDTIDPQELKREFHEVAESIKSKVEEYLQLSVSVGISRPYEKLSESPKAYAESLEALKCRISLGQDIIVHIEDIDFNRGMESAVYVHLKLLEDQLVAALKMGDAGKVNEIFQSYIAAVLEKDVYFNDFHVLFVQLISKIYQVLQDQAVPVKKVLGDKASIQYFMKQNTLEEIVRWFHTRLFDPILAFSTRQAETQYVNIANQMVKIIHERFDQDISLESCAAILNFHPVYVSRVFKKEIGINFSEYLMEYRMNVAKEWLENTSLKISEIAEKLTYTNTTAFIRTFRKIVGMTPGQYRETHTRN